MAGFGQGGRAEAAPGEPVELDIVSLAFGGEGVGRFGGLVVLVDRALPGDRVLAQITHRAARFARARIVRILSASPSRQPAPCIHYSECNGCAYQEAAPPLLREAKRQQVKDLLSRIGGFPSPPVAEVLPSPLAFHYRRRMTYSFPPLASSGPGLHRRSAPDSILEVPGCLLPEERVQAAYGRLLEDLRGISPGERPRRLEIHAGESGPPLAVLRGGPRPSREIRRQAAGWVEGEALLRGAVWLEGLKRNAPPRPLERQVLAGRGDLEARLAGFRYSVPAGCFFQANPGLTETVFRILSEKVGGTSRRILELYAGVGALTLFLAAAGRDVVAVEGDREAIRAGERNARENGCGGIEWREQDVRKALSEPAFSPGRFDVVVLDPPRTGLPPGTAARVRRLARRKVLYLSCNPATLARDLKEMTSEGGWALKEVVPADFFPQTAEIECLAKLERG